MVRTITAALAASLLATAPASARTLGQRIDDLPPSEWMFQGLNVADKGLTAYCLHRDTCREKNPILGRKPSNGTLILAGAIEGVTHAAVTSFLQDRAPGFVKIWEISTIAVGSGVVAWNVRFCF